jgi:hypothetical protein
VTYKSAPQAASPAIASAIRSACGPPGGCVAPLPMICPSRTTTAPTGGLGLVRPRTWVASLNACAYAWGSKSCTKNHPLGTASGWMCVHILPHPVRTGYGMQWIHTPFFHPDYTVGPGVSPVSCGRNRSRACRVTYRRWGIPPRPEGVQLLCITITKTPWYRKCTVEFLCLCECMFVSYQTLHRWYCGL